MPEQALPQAAIFLISFFQDQKISACGSSDRGAKGYQNVVRNPT
ncbi:hypothetical protein [Pseudomonas sp. MD195_PC81_125]|nr:hypothetical protein [Pseudomonas sp. MD195_PC81_125]